MTLTADIDATNYTYVHSNSRFGINSLNNEDAINILPQGTSSLFQSESLVISGDRKIFCCGNLSNGKTGFLTAIKSL